MREQFASFNQYGCDVFTVDPPPDDLPQYLTLAESFEIVREAPHAGTGDTDIWVLWREAGYETAFRIHLLKALESWYASGALFLREDNGRVLRLEPTASPAQWRTWLAYKREHADRFARAEQETRADAVQDANQWRVA